MVELQNNQVSVFGSVVAGVFQIVFRAEIHANDFFLFFKNYFWHQHIKTIQKIQTALNFNKKRKKFKFAQNTGINTVPNVLLEKKRGEAGANLRINHSLN